MPATEEEKVIVVRCLAYPGKNYGQPGYFAHCIDVDLGVFRPTVREAKRAMEDAIVGYFAAIAEDVDSLDEFQRRVNRPAPFWPYRAMYHWTALLRAIPGIWRTDRPQANLYDVPAAEPMLAAA